MSQNNLIVSIISRNTISIVLTLMLSFAWSENSYADSNSDDLRQLLQLTEYIGVDYSSAVKNGQVIDLGEYQEMSEFANIISSKSQSLLAKQQDIVKLAQSLKNAVAAKETLSRIQEIATPLKSLLLKNYPEMSLPYSLMNPIQINTLFKTRCASCHGETGQGNGFQAIQLDPKPTDFTLKERTMDRSVLGLFNVISGGLDGTAMVSFKDLTLKQRWSLAFYVGSLAFSSATSETMTLKSDLLLQDITQFSPNELIKMKKVNYVNISQLRGNPSLFFSSSDSPFATTTKQLNKAIQAYLAEDYIYARQLAVSAYLDGFELIENTLDIKNIVLRKKIELELLQLRKNLNSQSDPELVKQSISVILTQLTQAERLLSESTMSDTTLFSTSFIILLREGLEALLVVIALISILIRSDKKEALKYVHFGWITAMIAGILTWIAAQYLISISGASREIMEGVAALIASIVLFYVGFWMHSKTQADQWQIYIKKHIGASLKSGALWGVTGLTFITVYREVFETVLFYQSLLTQAAPSQGIILLAGFISAMIVLILFAALMVKFSIKLPIGKFFSATTYILLTLSFVLAGKAISALQEAAILSISPFPINFQLDLLGVYSTWQGLSLQLLILSLSMFLIIRQRLKS